MRLGAGGRSRDEDSAEGDTAGQARYPGRARDPGQPGTRRLGRGPGRGGRAPHQALRRPRRLRRRFVRGRLRRGVRLPRPERRREDHDRPHSRHAARADVGLGDGGRHPAQRRERTADPRPHLDHARVPRPLPPPDGHREPRVLRRPLRDGRCARAHRARPAGGQSGRPGRRPVRVTVQGPAPAGRARPGAPQRPGGAVPRRAHLRARPGRRP